MKYSKKDVRCPVSGIPVVKFEDQKLTSFAGIIVFQVLFSKLRLKERLRSCFNHLKLSTIFGHHVVTLVLIVHLLLGYRKLRDMDYYRDDPLVKRVLGLRRLPDVSTVSRALATADQSGVENIRKLCRELVLERLERTPISRITLDFDGSVFSTKGRHAEGTAVGFNRSKKGARSYYPLFCTVSQTGQVFDVYHRPGNVHDSNGAAEFMFSCLNAIRRRLPWVSLEVRVDSAFFSDEIVTMLDALSIEFTISVPFERFAVLKKMIETRKRWKRSNATWSYFESDWKPEKWSSRYRFLFLRQKSRKQNKEPVQLDLFVPHEYGYEFTVIVTNKRVSAKKVMRYHHGRGSQEAVFGELKSQSQMDYIAVRRLHGNQLYLMCAVMAHNLTRELQMVAMPTSRSTTEKRNTLWDFQQLSTIRHRLLQRAGRLTQPHGKLTLTMSCNSAYKNDLLNFLDSLSIAA